MQLSEDPLRTCKRKVTHMEIPKGYMEVNQEFLQNFVNVDAKALKSIKLSGSGYGPKVCGWLARNVLKISTDLEILDLSGVFQDGDSYQNAKCLYAIAENVKNHNLKELNVSNNQIEGIVLVQCLQPLLENCSTIKIINFNNCELGGPGVALLCRLLTAKNSPNPRLQPKLWEFNLAGNHMGEDASRDVAILFQQMDSLEKVDFQANNLKYGLRMILKSLFNSKHCLKELNLSQNKSINKAIIPLQSLIENSPKLKKLNISDLNLKKAYCSQLSEIILAKDLDSLEWSYDLEIDGKTAMEFLSKTKCSNIKMTGVFQNRTTRQEIREKHPGIVLFEPEYSGDESDQNDQPNAWDKQ